MRTHTVQFGEHLARIAYEAGFTDFRHVFNLPENAGLKSARKTPHVLAPGDEVRIPEREPKYDENAPTERRHSYRVEWHKLKLRLVVRDQRDRPVASLPCLIEVNGNALELKTDTGGKVEREVPHDAATGSLRARDRASGFEVDELILVGGLQPVDTVPGQIGRLNNLGYFAGDPQRPPREGAAPDPGAALRLRSAVEEFQCDHGLSVDGVCGPNTRAKLKEVHGC